jgi:hypothetical protein
MRDQQMPKPSKNNAVPGNRQLEELSLLAGKVTSAVSLTLELFAKREDSDDWLMIDRSLLIATAVRDSMRSTYFQLRDKRKRHLIAVALFELGDMSVIPDLIDAIESDEKIFMLAANKLAAKSIREAAPANPTAFGVILGRRCHRYRHVVARSSQS